MNTISQKASIYGNVKYGNNIRIDDFCILTGNIELGSHIHIGCFTFLSGRYGLILGDYVEIGPRITMLTCSDDFKGLSMVGPCIPDEFKPQLNFGKIILERHVVIGAHSVILPGVTIGEGAAVGAMSFVTKSLDPWGIYAGIPVKRIGDRSKSILDLQVAFEESRR